MAKKPTKPTKTIEEWRKALQALLYTEDFDTLLVQAEICIQEYPNLVEAYLMHGIANGELGHYEEAIKDYDKAIDLAPQDATAYNNRGTAKGNLERHEEAIKDFDKAIELEPDNASIYFNRGTAKGNLGRPEEAIKDFDKAIELEPDNASAYFNRGTTRAKFGQYEEAIKDYDKAIDLAPQDATAYNNRGKAKDKLGRHEEAIKDFDKAIELEPDNASIYFNRGNVKGELGQYEEAIKDFDKAIDLAPQDAAAYNNRGNAKGELGHYEEAIKDYDQAIKLDPNNTTAIQNKSLTFAKIEAEKSKEEFQEAFEAALTEIKDKQKEQLTEITNPQHIIKKYQSEIDETRYRLYGKNILYHTESYEQLCDETKCKISKMEGLVQDAQAASKRARYVLIKIAIIVIVLLILTHAKHDTESFKNANILELLIGKNFSPLTPLNLLQFTTITFLIYSPFLLHARYLARQAKEETVRLHSLIRERNRILFWQAQSNNTEQTNKARLATDVLKYMDGNSTADISLRMMDRPLFSRKSGQEEISLRADDVLHALKNLTPPKAE